MNRARLSILTHHSMGEQVNVPTLIPQTDFVFIWQGTTHNHLNLLPKFQALMHLAAKDRQTHKHIHTFYYKVGRFR